MVILVDTKDNKTGTKDKLTAHQEGLLHRAVSVLIFNSKGEILLQKRATTKYHSGGLWTNTACTHPLPDESNEMAAKRRLFEEMGIKTQLEKKISFSYKAFIDNNMIEHEFDHIFFGTTDKYPELNPNEAEDYAYMSYLDLKTDTELYPEKYTVWFKIILKEAEKEIIKYTQQLTSQ